MTRLSVARETAQDRKWKAESDARTLVQSEEIRLDKVRLGRAHRELKRQARAAIKAVKRKR